MNKPIAVEAAVPLTQSGTQGSLAGIAVRLAVMMFLEFAVFGSWIPTLGLVLATHGLVPIISTTYALASAAALISPLFLGAIGDRFFPSQRILAFAQIAGGAIMLALPSAIEGRHGTQVILLVFAYMLCFQPTLGLVNVIALRHTGVRPSLYSYIRVLGTLGWVAAGLAVGALQLSGSPKLLYFTAAVSALFGLYSFTLPYTSPEGKGQRFALGDLIASKSLTLFRNRDYLVFMVCVTLTAVALGVYNTFTSPYLGVLGISNVAGVLSIGQMSEVAFIVTIPWVLRRFGMKWALVLGMGMWAVRFALFVVASHGNTEAAVAAVALHGICSDFFIVVGALYIDRVAPPALAAQAQSMLILAISGIGQTAGSFFAGLIHSAAVTDAAGPTSWTPVWILPIVTSGLAALLWATLFRGDGLAAGARARARATH